MANDEIIWETLKNNFISTNNLQKNNFYDLTCNFWQLQKHVQHSRFSLCERYIFSPHLLISWHTYGPHICLCHDTCKCNFWHELQTIDQNIYLFLKNHNHAQFAYQLLWLSMAHEEIILETLKNYVTSSHNLQKKNSYGWIWNFGQLQKTYNTKGFLYWIHTYCHYICLHDNTSKLNFLPELLIIHVNIYWSNNLLNYCDTVFVCSSNKISVVKKLLQILHTILACAISQCFNYNFQCWNGRLHLLHVNFFTVVYMIVSFLSIYKAQPTTWTFVLI